MNEFEMQVKRCLKMLYGSIESRPYTRRLELHVGHIIVLLRSTKQNLNHYANQGRNRTSAHTSTYLVQQIFPSNQANDSRRMRNYKQMPQSQLAKKIVYLCNKINIYNLIVFLQVTQKRESEKQLTFAIDISPGTMQGEGFRKGARSMYISLSSELN